MFKTKLFLRGSMLALASSMALTGCAVSSVNAVSTPKQITEYMQAPQQYDIYAMDCSAFVAYENVKDFPYCMLLATDITSQKITFTVADNMYKTPKGAKETLKLNSLRIANLGWDMTETHTFNRATLAKMHAEEKILMVRRLTEQEVWSSVKSIARRPL